MRTHFLDENETDAELREIEEGAAARDRLKRARMTPEEKAADDEAREASLQKLCAVLEVQGAAMCERLEKRWWSKFKQHPHGKG